MESLLDIHPAIYDLYRSLLVTSADCNRIDAYISPLFPLKLQNDGLRLTIQGRLIVVVIGVNLQRLIPNSSHYSNNRGL